MKVESLILGVLMLLVLVSSSEAQVVYQPAYIISPDIAVLNTSTEDTDQPVAVAPTNNVEGRITVVQPADDEQEEHNQFQVRVQELEQDMEQVREQEKEHIWIQEDDASRIRTLEEQRQALSEKREELKIQFSQLLDYREELQDKRVELIVELEKPRLLLQEFNDQTEFEMPILNARGQRIAKLIAEIDDSDVIRNGMIDAGIKKMRLVTEEQQLHVKERVAKARLDIGLKKLPEGASLDIRNVDEIDDRLRERFQDVAKRSNLQLREKLAAIQVDKVNLKNKEDIDDAKIIFKIEKDLIDDPKRAKIFREDDGFYEMIPTRVVGEEDGYYVLEGDSSNGLSTFAVFMTESIEQTEKKRLPTVGATSAIPFVMIALIAGAIIATVIIRKKD